MKAPRARRLLAVSAISVLMAGGATIGAAGAASAAAPSKATQAPTNFGCFDHSNRFFNNCGFNGFNNGFGFRNGFNNGFNNGGFVVIVVS
ncbi:hypothetical protein ABZ915_31445 [Streptomyces sp. NPDC046915]|uniref:hypothetical protein n=1 Tax=Streptomyces sp. NPDC046915 TaxID=3155257 RepID=UPI0033F63E0F